MGREREVELGVGKGYEETCEETCGQRVPRRPYLESAITVHNVIISHLRKCLAGVMVIGARLVKSLGCGFYSCWLHFRMIYFSIK